MTSDMKATADRMEVRIDAHDCALTGYCVEIAPDMFGIDEGASSAVVKTPMPTDPEQQELAREAEGLCPTRAIKLLLARKDASSTIGTPPRVTGS